ncbi:MAG: UvrD-helicase domain-containing protein, partial [Candidatus Delongbacteria bacterium]|nr:UvrD-helicase domain-containing protein [Candidatus Delongbacteria bacterium]
MNINFDKIFLDNEGKQKQPEVIAESILLIKDIGQSYSIKSSMLNWLVEHGFNTSFLPEIRSIYDHAREITNTGPGKEIREEDFIVLMERGDIEGLLPKFREKNFRNYKKNLLRFMDYRGLITGSKLPKSVVEDLRKNNLSENALEEIEKYINSYDLYFKGQIFDKAIKTIDKLSEQAELFSLTFYDNEISVKEKAFLSKLNTQAIDFNRDGKYSSLSNALSGDKETEIKYNDLDLYVSNSPLDEAKKIKHLILDKITNSGYSTDDFTVVCSDKDLYTSMNNLFLASKIPVYSTYSYSGSNISTDILRVLIAGIEGDTQKILNFYNLNLTDEPLAFPDVSEYDLKTLYSKLIPRTRDAEVQSDLKMNFKIEKDEEARWAKEKVVRDFIKELDIKNDKLGVKKGLDRLHYKLKNLKKILNKDIDFDPYQYEEVLNKIFGENIVFSEMLEYLYLISAKSAKITPNKEQKGVRINMMNEPVSDSKYIIFAGLTQDNFLKTGNSIKFLQRENYQNLYKSVYGIDPDLTLVENFKIFTSGNIEKVAFFVPQWGDEVIPSTKIDDLLKLFPAQKAKIKIITDIKEYNLNEQEDLTQEFNYSINDLINNKDHLKEIQVYKQIESLANDEFSINYTDGNIEKYLSSASRIESFMSCPAKFVHDLNLKYNEIESQMPFTKGNFFHDVTEHFIRFYKGKELLSENDYNDLVGILTNNKTPDKIAAKRYGEFSEYYWTEISNEKFTEVYKILNEKIKVSGVDEEIEKYYKEQMENNPYANHKLVKQKYAIINFLARLIMQMGPTPVSVTNSFTTEVKFCDMIVSTDHEIKIGEGYIDFMFIDNKQTVQIIDIKSTIKFKKYNEEIENYQRVQILLYREAVLKQMNGIGGVDFDVSPGWRNPDCGILPKDYFTVNNASGEISSYYLSNESPYLESCDDEDYSIFLTKLNERLGNHKKFFSIANSNCEYCSLGASCPNNEQSKFEKIEGFEPDLNEPLPIPEFKEIISSSNEPKAKEYIMFSGEKDKAIKASENVIIAAGAGAGKTEVLSSKYVHLLVYEDIDIENIVCITFTKKAAGEMQNRIYRKLDTVIQSKIFVASDRTNDINKYKMTEKQITKLVQSKNKFFEKNLISTFHSFCNDQISKYGYSSENLKMFDIDQSISEDHQIKKET